MASNKRRSATSESRGSCYAPLPPRPILLRPEDNFEVDASRRETLELEWLEGVRLRWAYVRPVYLALLPTVVVLALIGDPAQLETFWQRLAMGLGLGLGFLGILPFVGHSEARDLLRRYARRT